jgi:peptidyl-prolyl cis-trans isomerase D
VSEADARQAFEQQKASSAAGAPHDPADHLPSPQKPRRRPKIRDGAAFEAVAAERNVSPQDLELGTLRRPRCSIRQWPMLPSAPQVP